MDRDDLTRWGMSTLERFLEKRKQGILLCLQNGLRGEALVLTYVTMDNLAWLDRAPGRDTVCEDDFRLWIGRYALPGSSLTCSAMDLWRARCSMLHDYSSESDWSRKGQGTPIEYVSSRGSEEELRAEIAARGMRAPGQPLDVAVRIEVLCKALSVGAARFLKELKKDPKRLALVVERARQLFVDLSATEWGDGEP